MEFSINKRIYQKALEAEDWSFLQEKLTFLPNPPIQTCKPYNKIIWIQVYWARNCRKPCCRLDQPLMRRVRLSVNHKEANIAEQVFSSTITFPTTQHSIIIKRDSQKSRRGLPMNINHKRKIYCYVTAINFSEELMENLSSLPQKR